LSFASAVVAGQNAQIKNASTSGLKKEMRRTLTASKKKRRGILSSLYEDGGEKLDSDDESSGSYRRQSKSKPRTKHLRGGSVVSNRRCHYNSDDDSSASSVPGSRKTSSTKRPASKTKRRSSRCHEYSDDNSSTFSLSPPRKNPARKPATSTSKKKIGGKRFLNDDDEDDVDSDNGKPPRKMSTWRNPGFNHSSNDEDEDDFDSDVEKEDNESDYIPQTDEAVNISSKENILGDSAEVIPNLKQAFMERAYPPGKKHSYTKSQSISAAIPTCRTKSELDYITFVVGNWQVGVKVRDMEIGYKRANLIQFCQ